MASYLYPAAWGFCGALVYAAGRLISVLLGEDEAAPRSARRAWAVFATAVLFGPIAAQGFGPTLSDWVGKFARPEAVWLVIGLSVNAIWPVIERLLLFSAKAWLGEKLKALGAALSGDVKP